MSAQGEDRLEALRQQRMLELQKQFESQAKAQAEKEIQTQVEQAENLAVSQAMKHLLSSEARSRLATISLATPERAEAIKKFIISLHENGKFVPPMSDVDLKSILASNSKSRNSASIRRI